MYCDLTLHDMIEFNTDNARTTRVTRSSLAMALNSPERILHQTSVYVGAKTLSFETALPKPAITTNRETPHLLWNA